MRKSKYNKKPDKLGAQTMYDLTSPAEIGEMLAEDGVVNHKQSRFIEEFMIDFNASRAYRDAGYTGHACNTADLLANPAIAAEIRRRCKLIAERTFISAEYVVQRLLDVALASPLDVVAVVPHTDKATGNISQSLVLKDVESLGLREKLSIQSMSCHNGRVSVIMCDKMKAWEMLGRHLGMFQDKVDHTTAGNPIPPAVQNIIQINFRGS